MFLPTELKAYGAIKYHEKRGKIMKWNEKLQRIIDYVELHLQRKQEKVDMAEIQLLVAEMIAGKVMTERVT